ncbi:ABC transporter substrate-binding protein [Denitratisoma sp. agr-D3]
MILIKKTSALSALVLGLLTISPAALAELTKVRFTLDWRFEGPQSVFVLAKQKGYFTQEGLDVSIDAGAGSSGTIQRLATGAYDMGFGDINTLIEFAAGVPAGQAPQAVYMVYDRAPFALFAPKKNGIKSPKDLVGNTISGATFDAARKTWPVLAKALGIPADSVKWVSADPALRATLVLNGSAQASTGFLNSSTEYTSRGVPAAEVMRFHYADYGVKLYGNAVLASRAMIEKNPKAVAGVVRAVNRALQDALSNPAEAIRALKEKDALINEALELERLKDMFPAIVTPGTRAHGLGAIDEAQFAQQVTDITEVFALKQRPDPKELFTPAFLPAEKERRLH